MSLNRLSASFACIKSLAMAHGPFGLIYCFRHQTFILGAKQGRGLDRAEKREIELEMFGQSASVYV